MKNLSKLIQNTPFPQCDEKAMEMMIEKKVEKMIEKRLGPMMDQLMFYKAQCAQVKASCEAEMKTLKEKVEEIERQNKWRLGLMQQHIADCILNWNIKLNQIQVELHNFIEDLAQNVHRYDLHKINHSKAFFNEVRLRQLEDRLKEKPLFDYYPQNCFNEKGWTIDLDLITEPDLDTFLKQPRFENNKIIQVFRARKGDEKTEVNLNVDTLNEHYNHWKQRHDQWEKDCEKLKNLKFKQE